MSGLKRTSLTLCVIALFALAGSLAQAEVSIGMPEKDLLAKKGPPVSKASFKGKSIYTWKDVRVVLEAGAVVKVEPRDVQKEQASESRRTQLAIAEKKKQEAERTAKEIEGRKHFQEQQRRLAAATKAESQEESDFDRDRRLRMEKYQRDRNISHLEEQMRQLDAAADKAWKAGQGDQYVRMKMLSEKAKTERNEEVRKNGR